MAHELFIPKLFAMHKRLNNSVESHGLRVYRDSPQTAVVQWRIRAKNGFPGAGYISGAHFNVAELKQLRDHLSLIIGDLEAT